MLYRFSSRKAIHPVAFLALLVLFSSCRTVSPPPAAPDDDPMPRIESLIPLPANVEQAQGRPFLLGPSTVVVVETPGSEVMRLARYLTDLLQPSLGAQLQVSTSAPTTVGNTITISTSNAGSLGREGYELDVTDSNVDIRASEPAGLFYAIQTLRQLLPSAIEAGRTSAAPLAIAAVRIVDEPRYEWRGAMLDVSRHFFQAEDVKQYIDYLAAYKMNRLHLHLADDQGWRIEIKSWPNLAQHGGSTQVGGGEGGFYTQDEYREIVEYASDRFITIVPEIDLPGHTNAALASYPELNCDDEAPDLYTGTEVGFSSLCVDREVTYKFVDDVLTELAMLTPGDYLHIGGDEVENLTQEEYNQFIERVQEIVRSKGKRMVGWDEVAHADLHPTSIVQHWRPGASSEELLRASNLIMSPANRAYLDMKYDSTTTLGLSWAGYVDVPTAYQWDPADVTEGLPEERVLGVEAPLWTETIETIADIEYMAFPRLVGFAEIGWTPADRRSWEDYRGRLERHLERWDAMGINYYESPHVSPAQ